VSEATGRWTGPTLVGASASRAARPRRSWCSAARSHRQPRILHETAAEWSAPQLVPLDPSDDVATHATDATPAATVSSLDADSIEQIRAEAQRQLEDAVDALATVGVDDCSDEALRGLLHAVKPSMDRLLALQTRWAGELEHRAIVAAPPGRQQTAMREARRRLQSDLRLTPSEAKRTGEVGRGLRTAPAAREAFETGELSQGQAAVIADTLRFVPEPRREVVEAELVEAAQTCDAAALRRTATRLLAREDLEVVEDQARRQQARRRLRLVDREDGGVGIDGIFYGPAAELARTALAAYTSFDGPDDRRQPDQRLADAFEQLCTVALRAGTTESQHGVRPHLLVLAPLETLTSGRGLVDLASTGPVPLRQITSLIADAALSLVAVDDAGAPVKVSSARQAVGRRLWKALAVRDRGCTWQDCDAPLAWCEVAHGDHPARLGGRLRLGNAALLCRRHHTRYDAGGWRMHIDGDTVEYERDRDMPPVRTRTLKDINAPP
jgi:hypothetical protein